MNIFNNTYALTFDIDWAPDFVIEKAARPLIENKIKCTWFVTHLSPYVEELFGHSDIFEFGIHPNFFPGSSHGKTEREVLEHICSIVPDGKSVRTHALYQSTRLLSMMANEFGIETDSSLFLNLTPGILPHRLYFKPGSSPLIRIPYFWEDDFFMYSPHQNWDFKSEMYHPPGIKVFNFHPVFIYLNSSDTGSYEKLKHINTFNTLTQDNFNPHLRAESQNGIGAFYNSLITYFSYKDISLYKMSELKELYLKPGKNNLQGYANPEAEKK